MRKSGPVAFRQETGLDLGQLIRERREAFDMTRSELAVDVGVQPANVRAWEDGTCLPDLIRFGRLCTALALCADAVLAGTETA